ncbi:MAG: energy transducer TonB, partial [Pseudomonadota bacterium]|nr:energy transducer TonB [Pseudomonadota bacterium]
MLKSFKNIVFGLVAASISVSAVAQDDRALDLDALLKQLEEGKFAQTEQNKQREQEFMAQRAEQDRILRETAQLRDRTLATSEQLET